MIQVHGVQRQGSQAGGAAGPLPTLVAPSSCLPVSAAASGGNNSGGACQDDRVVVDRPVAQRREFGIGEGASTVRLQGQAEAGAVD